MRLSLPPFSAPPKLVRLYSPSLRSVWPRCTPSAVSPPRCPVSAGSWWICGSTRPPSPHPSGRRAPVNLFAALLAVSPGTTLLIMSRPSCVYTRARALVLRHAHGGAGCQNGLKLPVVTVKLKHVLLTGEKWRPKEPLIYCESELFFHLAPLDVWSCFSSVTLNIIFQIAKRRFLLSPIKLQLQQRSLNPITNSLSLFFTHAIDGVKRRSQGDPEKKCQRLISSRVTGEALGICRGKDVDSLSHSAA